MNAREVKQPFKGTVIRSLLCKSKKMCKQDKKLRLRTKALERLDKMLDIRQLVRVHTNLAVLIGLLFSKEQLLLFKSQNSRALNYGKDGKGSSGTDSDSDFPPGSKNDSTSHKLPTLPKYLKKDQVNPNEQLKQLVGYKVETDIDRKLLRGVLEDYENNVTS